MMNTVNPVLSKHGLEASFEYPKSDDPKMVLVTCHLSHEYGYRESVTLPGPVDVSGSKNPIQQIKSTITYLRKATYEAVLGIASSDAVDDDGNGNVEVSFVTGEGLEHLKKLHKEIVTNNALFLKTAKIKSLDEINDVMDRIFDNYNLMRKNAFRCYEDNYVFSKHFSKVIDKITEL